MQGRAVGRLLHRKPFWVADHTQVQADGRVLDEEGRDLRTTVIGNVAVWNRRYPVPEHEHWAWDASTRTREPPAWDLKRMEPPPVLPELAAGDLVRAKRGRGWPDDRSDSAEGALRLHRCVVAGRGMSAEKAGAHVAAEL